MEVIALDATETWLFYVSAVSNKRQSIIITWHLLLFPDTVARK